MFIKQLKYAYIILFPIAFLAGILLVNVNLAPKNNYLEKWATAEESVEICGIIKDISYTSTGRQKVIVQTDNVIMDEIISKTKINVQVILDLGEKVEFAQEVRLGGKLNRFDFVRNFGGFDEFLYMKSRKIDYKMYADYVCKGNVRLNLQAYIYKLQEKFGGRFNELLPSKEAGILKSMLLGDKQELSEEIRTLYKEAGISHILAISGLHISIICAFIVKIFELLQLNKRLSSAIIIIVLCFYCILTGSSVSTVRAVTMVTVVMFGNIIYRETDLFTSISFSAIILLLYQPLYLFDIGFQLSYSAVIGIIVLSPVFNRIRISNMFGLKQVAITTISASASTFPIIVSSFYTFSLIGLVVNMLLVPLAGFVVAFGILAFVFSNISITLGHFFCGLVYYILLLYEKVCETAVKIPFSNVLVGKPSMVFILAYYVLMATVAWYCFCPQDKRLKLKAKFIFVTIFLSSALFIGFFKPQQFKATYLDVGQGDSICIQTPKGKNIIIDGGNEGKGKMVIAPYLSYCGINALDYMFLSHADADHIVGLIEILEYVDVRTICVPDIVYSTENELYGLLLEKAKQKNINVKKLKKDDIINIEKDLYIKCIFPYEQYKNSDLNESSMVFTLFYEEKGFIFTGDIGQETEKKILSDNSLIKSDILKAAHHGSKNSSSCEFLAEVSPKIVVISSGKNNRYNHPHEETLARYEVISAQIYNTANDGAITIIPFKGGYEISTMRERKIR